MNSTPGTNDFADVGRSDDVDTGTIGWLLPEIVAAFDAATASLRTFRAGAAGVERADVDLGPLRVARSHLHQAHGALELSELAGVGRLTEAMEALLGVFEEDPARCDATAIDAITGGCRAVVEYLEDLQGGARPQPLYLFPSYRDLLAARKADRIHPADLLAVDADARPPRDDGGVALDADGLAVQRRTFEQGLLRYIRNEDDATALASLAGAIAAIDGSVAATAKVGQSQQRAFWWVAHALFDALAHDGFVDARAQHAPLKRLAGRINLQIRKLAEGSTAIAERLFADTLFFVAIARPVTDRVRAVQATYRLADAVPKDYETQRYGRIDPAALKTAREAIGAAKAAWSATVAGDVGQIRAFAKETGALLDAVGAIRRRGLVRIAQVIDGIATDLGFDPRQPAAAVGLDVATALLFIEGALERARSLDDAFDERAAAVVARVEASALGREHTGAPLDWLDRMSREAEERLTVATFVAELQANLRSAEKVLDAFFRDPTRHGDLKDAGRALAQVSGALALLGHDDVHRAIDGVRESIDRYAADDADVAAPIDPAQFEAVAESLGAVGFYVEQIKRDRIDPAAFRFDARSGRFHAALARPASATAPIDDEPVAARPAPAADELPRVDAPEPVLDADARAFAATEILEPEASLEDEIVRRAGEAAQAAARLAVDADDRVAYDALVDALDDVRRSAQLMDDRGLQDAAGKLVGALRDDPFALPDRLAARVDAIVADARRAGGASVPPAAPVAAPVAVPSADEAVDAELLEVFLEEAGAVLADAEAAMRVIDADPENGTAAKNLRRGFHTLKGSSRMVGLFAFGEAAWSIEETLNGFLADGGAASSDLRALVDYAIRYLASWLAELREAGVSARIPDALIEAARAVRTGQAPSLASPTPPVPTAPDAPTAPRETRPALPEFADDDFAKTLFLPRTPTPIDDLHFAATEVLGDEPVDASPLFFGEQPRHAAPPAEPLPTLDLLPSLDFDAPSDRPADGEATAEPFDAVPVAFDTAGPADEVPTFDRVAAEGTAADPSTPDFANAGSPDAALGSPDAPRLDFGFADDPTTVATTLDADDADADASTADVGPFDDVAGASSDERGRESAAASAAGDAPSVDNVLPFNRTPPAPVRHDDVRQIGPLTLSVALFNIYLTEADELLRVLTQDFAEWRHELDRVVSEGSMRAVHSLAGSSSTVGLVAAHDLASAIEEVLLALYRHPVALKVEQVERLQDAIESLRRMLHRFAAERMPDPDPVRIAGLLGMRRDVSGAADAAALPFGALDFAEGSAPVREAARPRDAGAVADDERASDAVTFGSDFVVPMSDGRADVAAPSVEPPVETVDAASPLDAFAELPDLSFADAGTTADDGSSAIDDATATMPPATPTDNAAPTVDVPFDAVVARIDEDLVAALADPLSGTAAPATASIEAVTGPSTDEAVETTPDRPVHASTEANRFAGENDVPSVAAIDATPESAPTSDEAAPVDDAAIDFVAGIDASDVRGATIDAAETPTASTIEASAAAPVDDGFAATEPLAPGEAYAEVDAFDPTDAAVFDPFADDGAVVPAGPVDEAVTAPVEDVSTPTGAQASIAETAIDAPAAPQDSSEVPFSEEVTSLPEATASEEAASSEEAFGLPGSDGSTPPAAVEPPVAESSADETLAASRRAAIARESAVQDDLDPDLVDVFVAEGGEILPQIGTLLRTWQAQPDNPAPSRMLLRHLHTLKGSARMAGAMRLGEVVHDLETRVEATAKLAVVPAAVFDEIMVAHDRSLELYDQVQHPELRAAELAREAAQAAAAASDAQAPQPAAVEAAPVVQPTVDAGTAAAPRGRDQKQPAQQQVRIGSETLDRLVNLAGEVSISRARIENEVQQIKGAMADLVDNVDRLRTQLREIELQAEFQMQSRMQSQQQPGAESEKFDPLEFDRFTRFQELTRMMAESVNDVKTVQQNLQKSLDTAETDLASQRRMTRDLQQDLMQVRMVPFSSIAERLYRVARRSAKEVDKRVNLDIRGGSVEIDRGVLERMAGPFEHLLRNHIVHGVESRGTRRAHGKDETGELLVEVRQEGNEIVLTFSDDGAGLDHARIRAKGRELGLVDGEISDAQAAELIFHPGFSTASEVTELAGRGVGMDVVRAEAQELGGRVSVDSEPGRGTRFTIRLPLTLAITQVVLVAVANRVYALPAVLVEQVQQMRSEPLAESYRAGKLEWTDGDIPLAFLGTLLGLDDSVPVAQRISPVLILRSAGQRMAVHVDEVVSNQEVVVKNLGPQLARMIGIVGATVLGSGEIVLILNPVQLAQMARAPAMPATPEPVAVDEPPKPEAGLQTLPTVMVVDDSLTVRRVTQRLLSREGYQVVLAKDGVDALEQLQDFPPDAMLVDIEMPRMDGFDLTRNVRNDERFKHIPIIMITSRTAEKHRRHAAELGVDAYLGKPYQEDELLDLLTKHVAAKRTHPA